MTRKRLLIGLVGIVVLVSAPWLWTFLAAQGHLHAPDSAPSADVVIVLGTEPGNRLQGRLDTTAEMVTSGRARAVLVSGDRGGERGDEIAAMTDYLVTKGVDRKRIVADPYGLDTYDTCVRARDVYGVSRALVVTQSYHLTRAVTLCRHLGIDAEGVRARCDCSAWQLTTKALRDYVASGKAVWDVIRSRPPAVTSPASGELSEALKA
jgi:vancomycin permeability regulator SanA